MTAYNVMISGSVIAEADCWPANDRTSGYVIEVVPFESLAKKAGIEINSREEWDDFYDSEESNEIPPEQEQIRYLMSTIVAAKQLLPEQFELRIRKEVFELEVGIEERFYDMVMVCQHESHINVDKSDIGIFIHDVENHDMWHFPLETSDIEMLEKMSRSLKAYFD